MSDPAPALGDVTDDGFLDRRIRILQPRRGFRAAIDSVLLPAAVELRNGIDILDAGIGVGIASLCLLARVPEFRVTGVEIQTELAALASENARRNGFALDIQCKDFLSTGPDRLFDQVMTNPPYFEAGEGTQPPLKAKTRAHVASEPLGAWLYACVAHLKLGGVLTLIHRAEREADILAALDGQAGDIEILPLIPKPGEAPRRILLRARKGASGPIRRWPGLVLHGDTTKYTERAEAILRHAHAVRWSDAPFDPPSP